MWEEERIFSQRTQTDLSEFEFRVSVHKARDNSSEMKDVIKAEEEGETEELTYSRLQEHQGVCPNCEAEGRFGVWGCCVKSGAKGVN